MYFVWFRKQLKLLKFVAMMGCRGFCGFPTVISCVEPEWSRGVIHRGQRSRAKVRTKCLTWLPPGQLRQMITRHFFTFQKQGISSQNLHFFHRIFRPFRRWTFQVSSVYPAELTGPVFRLWAPDLRGHIRTSGRFDFSKRSLFLKTTVFVWVKPEAGTETVWYAPNFSTSTHHEMKPFPISIQSLHIQNPSIAMFWEDRCFR